MHADVCMRIKIIYMFNFIWNIQNITCSPLGDTPVRDRESCHSLALLSSWPRRPSLSVLTRGPEVRARCGAPQHGAERCGAARFVYVGMVARHMRYRRQLKGRIVATPPPDTRSPSLFTASRGSALRLERRGRPGPLTDNFRVPSNDYLT